MNANTRLDGLLARAEAQMQEELGAQRRLERLFAEQERALGAREPVAVTQGLDALRGELDAMRPRELKHQALLRALAGLLGVAQGALTYGSLVERVGPQATRLARARGELLESARNVQQRGRRLAALARAQQSILAQVLSEAFGAPGASPDERGAIGSLIDQRA